MSRLFTLVLLGFALLSPSAEAGSRSVKKFGINAAIGEPFNVLYGINANYNLLEFLRITAGWGKFNYGFGSFTIDMMTFGGGLHLFVPNWDISPTIGFRVDNTSVTITGTATNFSVPVGNTNLLLVPTGLDFQAGFGMNIGAGVMWWVNAPTGAAANQGTPFPYSIYAHFGWYF